MHLFYTPDISGETYTLNEEESKHCIRVLRQRKGDEIFLIDGRGGFYKAVITDDNPKKCEVSVVEKRENFGAKNYYLHIAIAPPKNIDRLEWFLEKATEIGIDEITPVICGRSERTSVKTERLTKVITSAVKQSIKAFHPKLNEAIDFKKIIETDFTGQKFIAHCLPDEKPLLKNVYQKNDNALILIGPEGDFTADEVALAVSKGFIPMSLGESRLRTETAALVACATIQFCNQ